MRYLWDLYPAYRNEFTESSLKRALMAPVANYLRLWDYSTAARVDEFVANSANVARRIWKTYRREARVMRVASPKGPRGKKSMKAVSEVLTPVIVCTPLGTSSMYTPG